MTQFATLQKIVFALLCFLFINQVGFSQCPVIEGAMVNPCNTSSNTEGVNEFLVFRTTVATTVNSYTLYYGSNATPKTSPTSVLSGASATTSSFRGFTATGCTITYVTSPTTIIPANSRVIFIPRDCNQAYDISSLCYGGSIYIVFINRTLSPSSWAIGGNFANSATSARYLQLVNGTSTCTAGIVSYTNRWASSAGGNFVAWDANRNATYVNNGCSVILPLDYISITPSAIAPVCFGSSAASLIYTAAGNPDQYSITWSAAALAAGFVNVSNASLPVSPLTIATPVNAPASTYAGTLTATKSLTGVTSSGQTISVTIKATSASTTNVALCASQLPYVWNGNSYNSAGTFSKTLVNAVGCDSIATLVLTVKSSSASTTNAAICPSALPYFWNDSNYAAAGTYTKTFVNAAGCDSVATLILIVKSTSASTTNVSICSSLLPYRWNDSNYTAAGTYTKTLVNAAGCDSVATLVLTVRATSSSTTNISACQAQLPYSWNGGSYNAAGTYTKKLVNAVGCDSVATLVLSVFSTITSTFTKADVACNTVASGSITVSPLLGNGPFTYRLGTAGASTPSNTFSNLRAGTYRVYITDGNSCTGSTAQITILQQTVITGTYTKTDVTCYGLSNGSLTLTPTSGTSPYTYQFGTAGTYGSSNVKTSLAAGDYRAYIQDANACIVALGPITIAQPAQVTATATATNVTGCNGGTNGKITLTNPVGVAPFKYKVGSAGTYAPFTAPFDITGLKAASYAVYIQDANGCEGPAGVITVGQPAAVVVNFTKVDITCSTPKGSISLSAPGSPGATYKINPGSSIYATQSTYSGLVAGTYYGYAKDVNGCASRTTPIVFAPATGCRTIAKSAKGVTETDNTVSTLQVSLSPNPSSNQFMLTAHSTSTKPVTIRLIDALGRSVYHAKGNVEQSFRFGNQLSNGLYLVEIRQGDEVKTVKAVKGK